MPERTQADAMNELRVKAERRVAELETALREATECLHEVATDKPAASCYYFPQTIVPRLRAVLAGATSTDGSSERRPLGCGLAMHILQSKLYWQLDEIDRAECDELAQRNLEWAAADLPQSEQRPSGEELGWCNHCGEGVTDFCRGKQQVACARGLPRVNAGDLTKLNELAQVHANNYASPHHFTMSVEGLRNLIGALAAETPIRKSALFELRERIAADRNADALAAHAIEELHQLGYTVRDGRLIPPDNLGELARVAGVTLGVQPSRTPQDYAIEHAGYMADAARHLLEKINAEDAVRMTHDESFSKGTGEALDSAMGERGEAIAGLRSAIYEFEKRRDRATSAGVRKD